MNLLRHPARPAPSLVINLADGERQRFSASAMEENQVLNALRSRALRRGRVEGAPAPHPFGVALVRADEASLSPELKAAAKQQRALEDLIARAAAAKRGVASK